MKFTIPVEAFLIAPTTSSIGGSDVSMRGGDFSTSDAGDWVLVDGVAAARQSVEREIPAQKGSMVRRPTWGGGLSAMLFKGLSRSTKDQMVSAARACLLNNPRITKINSVTIEDAPTGQGVVVRVDADSVDGRVTASVPVTPVGRTNQ